MKKTKGFTLIEIIATVAILGIMSVIAIVSVNGIIQKGKDEHYKAIEENTALATESYVQTNRDDLPKNVGEKKKIPLRTLVEKNYIEPPEDYYNKQCNLDNSYVIVYKYSKNSYSYTTYLDCPNYNNKEELESQKPVIEINMSEDSNNVKKTKTDIKITDPNKILSYTITIYKYDEEVYSTGNVEGLYETIITKRISIDKYTPGELKVVVTATNIFGNTTTKTMTKKYQDKKAPECIIANEDTTRTNDDWQVMPRKITVGCNDGENGSGCTRESFTKTFTSDDKYGYITIKDKAGNETECKVDVFIDKTRPNICEITLTGTKGNNDWYKTNVKVELKAADEMSGIKDKGLTTLSTVTYNNLITSTQTETKSAKWYGYVNDYSNNSNSCSTPQFKVDTTPPTAPTGGTITVSGTSKDAEVGEVGNSYDATSGIQEYKYLIKVNDSTVPKNTDKNFTTSRSFTRSCGSTYYAYAIAIDKAGNISDVHFIGKASDGKDEYSAWSKCTKECGTGTQTRTNSCELVTKDLQQNCNTRTCCSKVTYKDGTSCSAACGNGTYNQLAYSAYDGSRCENEDKTSGGSTCFLKSCCTESTTYGDYSACTCKGGGSCTKTRSYSKVTCNNGVATTTTGEESISCTYPSHTHVFKARGTSLKNTSFTWTCTRGHSHKTGYYIYCQLCVQRPTSGATLVCPTNPYGPAQGWTLIED